MAKVFLGSDTVLGRTVAVKVLAPQFADDGGFVQRFRREAQAAASIGHPNIVSVFDTGSDDGVHFIVMEYVEGRTLAEILAGGGRILPDRAIDIAMDVCRALEAAHARGVIHRDIKPGNIMLNPRGEVKVTDFGIARVTTTADTVAQTAAILGTASYLSPEQAQGQPVDGRSDIYSLGCVLYEMVTGRPPFLGDSPVAVASKQVLEQPTPPSRLNPDVTADLDAVILRALAKNPANRYQSAEEMRADLERAKRGLPVQATPLLAAGTTQVLDRPPAHCDPGASAARTRARHELGADRRHARADRAPGGPAVVPGRQRPEQRRSADAGCNVTVPDVVGKSRTQAEQDLSEAGLEVGSITRVPAADDTQQPGTVLEQDPAANAEVERGTAVDLTIVATPDQVAIPSLEGSSLEEAQATLTGLGLVPAGPQEEPSDTIDAGLVTRTDPASGTDVDPGSQVTIFVSAGPTQVHGARGSVPELRLGPERARQGGTELGHLQRDRAHQPGVPTGEQGRGAGSGARDAGRPRQHRDLVPGRRGSHRTGPTGGTGETGG